MGTAERLVATWRERGVALNAGASPAELDDLRRMLGVELPEDIREFYSLVNGMPDGVYDEHSVSFWSISKIRDECGKWHDQELGFADVLVNSWRFIFRADDRSVSVLSENVAPGQPKENLGRFGTFLEIYTTDSDRLRVI